MYGYGAMGAGAMGGYGYGGGFAGGAGIIEAIYFIPLKKAHCLFCGK